jgi:hypothetical protein
LCCRKPNKKKEDVGVKVVAGGGQCAHYRQLQKEKKGAEFMILPLELYLGFWV